MAQSAVILRPEGPGRPLSLTSCSVQLGCKVVLLGQVVCGSVVAISPCRNDLLPTRLAMLAVLMKRDEPIVTEERRAEHCKKVRSNERSRVSAPEVTQTGWYPSISVATCKWQRQGRCRTQPQRGKATC
ncbi:uncharacterized protein LOC142364931 isoform X5 [Opisthocomus hoazin]|uniref:uncharacterized protein LOC142364931 isoform X5 n=1 Tax=Opisthocomus hoazin TaxID=30419 RepID=UPI003F52E3D9